MIEPLTYTVEETAALLGGLGINQTYAGIKRGDIPSIKIGRRILVPRARLLAMLNGDPEDDGAAVTAAASVPANPSRLGHPDANGG